MKIANLFLIALKALRRNKLRALLTMLGIIIGVASVIAMVAIGQGSKKSIQDQLSSMGSNMITIRPNSNVTAGARLDISSVQTLTLSDVDALKKESKYLNAISPAVSSKGQAINGALNWPTSMQGVSVDYLKIRDWPLKDGIAFRESDVHTANKVCLVGQTVVDNIFPYGANPIGQIIRFNKIPFRIIGVLQSKGENAFGQDQDDIIIAPFSTVQKRITNSIYLQNIYASTIDESHTEAATGEIEQIMRTAHRLKAKDEDDFSVRTQAELINTFSSTSQLLTVLLTAISGISLLIGGIGIMNIMYVSVTERTKEIGLRMSIGANGRDILLQFLVEAILISLTGGLIGILLGILASELIQFFLQWPTLISESSVILSFLVCAITGIFFGYYPALKASKLDPIEALHYE
ncbi:ABC transporter permease [Flavobacterium quisquiliarum]|uniref:ABC transporter permease n=1 Tax=Flavobacterium quisquiliarum TaxID=1834436 RepID=A0ABV8VZG1_9FLAO|nr:ABC transporter permease [Flavobacterium quisquiliarum]MBW1654565.1 FtsX-like permease family protein [Flavobacterium quisquiliarum]NWL01750.1 multidrug ABC transporter substrate-binding protein [Flavobacterium collinsii]